MLGLYYAPGACSLASHIILEESGEKYNAMRLDLASGEQRTEKYLKLNPLGRVPVLILEDGTPIPENTAILPYLGKRFSLWPNDATGEAKALSLIGFLAATVHPAHAHVGRVMRYSDDPATHPAIQAKGRAAFWGYLQELDARLAGREWVGDSYSVLDPYVFTFYTWGYRHNFDLPSLKNYTALRDRMLARPAVQRVIEDEKIKA